MRYKNYIFALAFILMATVSCHSRIKEYKVEVVKTYKHDTKAYTQGLFFEGGNLYESTGQYGESSFRKVNLSDGKVLENLKFANKYFAEGSVVLNDKLYILTWTNKVAFVYDFKNMKYLSSYSYPREGWGLTTDGKSLIASDGSSRIYFMTPEFKQERAITVKMNGRAVRYINELEWIEGKIWANVYLTDLILIIDPKSGEVEASIDCSNLLPDSQRTPDTDVLNGIAYNPETKKIYITGKNWPALYEIKYK